MTEKLSPFSKPQCWRVRRGISTRRKYVKLWIFWSRTSVLLGLILQYGHELDGHGNREYDLQVQQQLLRPSFEDIRDSVRELVGKKMEALARQFAATHDMKVKVEIDRLSSELVKLDRP
jgi:hypothetical protein